MRLKKRKGFTLVELLVVIAILAVLATVAILGYSSFIKKANITNDKAIVEQMNKALLAYETIDEKARYCDEAVDQCINEGFILENLTPSTSGFHFAYDQQYNRFMLLKEDHSFEYGDNNHTNDKYRIHVVVGSDAELKAANEEGYSTYIREEFEFDENSKNTITTSKGIDVGKNVNVSTIIYNNSEGTQDVVIRTNTFGTRMTVEGTDGDTVTHYGFAGLVEVKKVAMASYDEYGVVGRLSATATDATGHIDIKEGATVYQVEQLGGSSTKVSVDANATVYDINHEKVEGAVQDETVKFTSTSGTTVDTSKIGTAVGDTITASACKHENTEDVVDSQHVYEVCKTCGYTLIKVNDNKKTVATSNDANAENVIIPKAAYASSQLASGSGDANNGSNGAIVLQPDSSTETGYVEPSVEKTPKVDNDTPTNPSCQHNWQYTSNSDGTHKVKCSKCSTSYTENCNKSGTDGACSKCGYLAVNYLTFTALENNSSVTVNFKSGTWQYSTDGGNSWNDGDNNGTTIQLATKGTSVYLRGNDCTTAVSTTVTVNNKPKTTYSYCSFDMTGKIAASGSVTSLIDNNGTDCNVQISKYQFYHMFHGCTSLETAPELPAKTLAAACYQSMFYGCASLVTAPELPAETLAANCYYEMFYGCTSLETAPELPAETLFSRCYQSMFEGCTSLEMAPELPAKTVALYCYNKMFYGCTSLKTAPELPAETLASGCYYQMFEGCTSLKTVPKLPAKTLADNCYQSMFSGCTSLEIAPELSAETLASNCCNKMFKGCTSLVTAPELSTTTLARYCYLGMFSDCTSLEIAPKLPATTLVSQCYYEMFSGCASLVTAPELPAKTLAVECYIRMFYGCTSLETAPELPATTAVLNCYYEMFYGCTSLKTAPELPATTLANYCYDSMFYGCTSLVTAPELPATSLATGCYYEMFYGCTSLLVTAIKPDGTEGTDYGVIISGSKSGYNNSYAYMFDNTKNYSTANPISGQTYYWRK